MRISVIALLSIVCICAFIEACAPWPERPQPFANNPVKTKRAADIVKLASAELGAPYAYGGATPRGFDCSGLVYYVFRHAGLAVPRTANEQLYASHPVKFQYLQPGDLVFFEIAGNVQMHVGIYVGKGKFVHAPETGQAVSYARLENSYWKSRFVGGGRF
ncbi:MAG TPA: C40 family peptidase [Gammaproteobacteria bacterium]|nr:C40 family peptidase [Gammaproteobacteria bacterium]